MTYPLAVVTAAGNWFWRTFVSLIVKAAVAAPAS